MKNNKQTQKTDKQTAGFAKQAKFNRLAHFAQNAAKKIHVFPEHRRGKKLHHGEIQDEFEPAVVLTKANRTAWAQRSKCGQKWTCYSPFHGNEFRACQKPTLNEALKTMAGWLGFTWEETQTIL